MRILIVDDNAHSLQSLAVVLADLGYEPVKARNADEALQFARQSPFPMIITDIRMPGMSGLELLSTLKDSPATRDTDVVIITGHGDMETAIASLRKGAYDYLNKPINARELAAVVERCAEHQALLRENQDWRQQFETRVDEATREVRSNLDEVRSKLRGATGVGRIIASSQPMRTLVEETRLYRGDPSVPVLLEGETGTGKEVLALLIHYGDQGSDQPFVPINCAAIPSELFESELFGHEPGAYTGSSRKGSRGKMELAGEGTLFLDEIAEMPLSLQPKLLRVLEDRTFYRVGGIKKRHFEARVVCAANRDLRGLVEQGLFRRDLYHRLKVGHMRIPPLRERGSDIRPLAELFLKREAHKKKKLFKGVSPEALALLEAHPWPGNVRELENTIERAVLTSDGDLLEPSHLAFLFADTQDALVLGADAATLLADPAHLVLPEHGLDLEALYDALIHRAMEKFDGNKTRAARYLGISRYALHRRLGKA
ncbi:MAG: sigma-54-dependent transcriptional regulator [Desulfovibrionaceae bacterium]